MGLFYFVVSVDGNDAPLLEQEIRSRFIVTDALINSQKKRYKQLNYKLYAYIHVYTINWY